jgi:hypothetical protein
MNEATPNFRLSERVRRKLERTYRLLARWLIELPRGAPCQKDICLFDMLFKEAHRSGGEWTGSLVVK